MKVRMSQRLERLESVQWRDDGERRRQIETDAEDFMRKIEALAKSFSAE